LVGVRVGHDQVMQVKHGQSEGYMTAVKTVVCVCVPWPCPQSVLGAHRAVL
jgi:hypothetical protein